MIGVILFYFLLIEIFKKEVEIVLKVEEMGNRDRD